MSKKYFEHFIPLVDAIAGTFGNNCEVVLHDFSKPHQSIIKIVNGHITGREIGSPATDLILSLIKNKNTPDFVVGYRTRTKKGHELKLTTIFIRNNKKEVVGALCINVDITPYISAKNLLEELCTLSNSSLGEEKESPEKFESTVDILIQDLLKKSMRKIGKPVAHMSKEDKLQTIRALKENGLFLIKGSAKRVSKELNVSLPTIYKYLEEI